MEFEGDLDSLKETTLWLSQYDASRGIKRSIQLSEDEQVEITVPPGAYDGQKMYLDEADGYPHALLITIHITDKDEAVRNQTAPTVTSTTARTMPHNRHPLLPHRQHQRKLRLTAKMAIILSVLTLMVIGSGMLGYMTLYRPYMKQVQATATVDAIAAQTAQVKATRIAHQIATATAQARATLTALTQHQNNYDDIVNTRADINDDLHAPDTFNWDTGSGCSFTNQTYTATVTQHGFFLPCLAKNITLHNFMYQTDMNIVKGDAGGLIMRARDASSQSYIFVVGQDGSYSVYYYAGDDRKAAQTLTDGYSDTINTGNNTTNTLGVIASGTSLDFYINKKYITSIVNTRLTTGKIGVLANSYKHPTEIRYRHAKVWKL
ncbi:hypothetical protein KDI_17020 [Dictyobacter arantiisoli]|uniref:3-keto-disaccharide hydrolase domain-containing protein n=2 Tax=Dictyobacter arantiisoli TaxID=2014874 RepID=A0A5A5T9R9_9CHLR|nr:hypothetical protein KDI_17020 [Dictyobacter arantiisoli]